MIPFRPHTKEQESLEIQKLTDEFLAKGGVIEQIPYGKRTLEVDDEDSFTHAFPSIYGKIGGIKND